MKLIPVFILFVFCLENASAQSGTWTWMGGDTTYDNAYGYAVGFGIPDSLNKPGATYAPCYWKDTAGNFWMFGGVWFTYDDGEATTNNDLWMFNPKTNLWTLVASGGGGYYFGHLRVPDTFNYPPPTFGAASWVDKNGDLWLFGGLDQVSIYEYAYLNDVWRYNIKSNIWTWMGGSDEGNQLSVYGTKGVGDTNNIAGGREFPDVWLDKDNNVWIFGGVEDDVFHNDLWKYEPDSNVWTWESGAPLNNGTPGGYWGTLGIPSPFTTPRGRQCDCHWQDSSGNLYLFGGFSYGAGFEGYFNDVWKYSLSTNEWTWIAGEDSLNYYDLNSELCTSSIQNSSASRDQPNCWQNHDGSFSFFGGAIINGLDHETPTSDVWKFNPINLEWTRLNGLGDAYLDPYYGRLRVPDSKNEPPPRYGAAQWFDEEGNIWIFGGQSEKRETNNDLWRYTPDSSCFVATGVVSIQNTFQVYPNPAHNSITISFPFSNNTITLSDLYGRVLEQLKIESGNSKVINTSFLHDGVYLISVEDENGNLIASAKLFKE